MASHTAKLIRVASNGQISIGKEWAGRQIRVEKVNDSEIRIVSGAFVPDQNATFHSQEAKEKLDNFNRWAKGNPPKATSATALFDRLEKKSRGKAKKRA